MNKSKSGFTIIELVTVIVVIGILATIGVLSYNGIQAKSRDAERSTKTTIIADALEKYYEENGEYPTCDDFSSNPANFLTGIDKTVLISPMATTGTANSINCTGDPNNSSFSYKIENGRFVISYIEEVTEKKITISGRRGGEITAEFDASIEKPTIEAMLVEENSTTKIEIYITTSGSSDITNCRLQISDDANFSHILLDKSNASCGKKDDTEPENYIGERNKTLYLQSLVIKNSKSGDWSKRSSITTPALNIAKPILTSNTIGATTTWEWNNIACPDTNDATDYYYKYFLGDVEMGPIGWKKVDTLNNKLSKDTSSEGFSYGLQIQAKCTNSVYGGDGVIYSDPSEISYYTNTSLKTPTAPSVSYPAPDMSTNMELSWIGDINATGYQLQIDTSQNFTKQDTRIYNDNCSTLTEDGICIAGQNEGITNLPEGITWYIRVRAMSGNDNFSNWSGTTTTTTPVYTPGQVEEPGCDSNDPDSQCYYDPCDDGSCAPDWWPSADGPLEG